MIDIDSKEYRLWKSFYGVSYFEKHYNTEFLYLDRNGSKFQIDNLSLKNFGLIHYFSWTESCGFETNLIILELEPHRHRQFKWIISPAKGNCFFWVNRWTEKGLFIIYNDSATNYALRIILNKKPKGIKLEVTELAEKICIKRNWTIGFKSYTDRVISRFDLKIFEYIETMSEEDAGKLNIIPSEQGEYNEELE